MTETVKRRSSEERLGYATMIAVLANTLILGVSFGDTRARLMALEAAEEVDPYSRKSAAADAMHTTQFEDVYRRLNALEEYRIRAVNQKDAD